MAAILSTPTAVDARALTDAQQGLLTRLHAYSPDDPTAPLPYSRRLAEAEGWSHAHALAVIDEYKRFAFLAQAAGHPVTPSVAVDAAWHFHLQYTLEYWDVFCAGVLRARLHHMPGTGALDEAAVYAQRYRDTLDSYRRLFGCEPPEAIWPRPVAEAAPADAPVQRAAPSDGPSSEPAARPQRWRRFAKLAWPTAAISVAATCASASDFNVLDFSGPDFLGLFYVPLCVAALLLIAGLQWIEYRHRVWGTRAPESSPDLSAEEAAYLAGGGARMAQVVMLSLAHAGAIELRMSKGHGARVRIDDPRHAGAYGADWEWLRQQPGGETSCHAFRQRLAWREADCAAALQRKGWLWAPGEMRATRMAARGILLLVFGAGAAKLAVGLSRGRPVLLLMIVMAAFMVAYHFMVERLPGFGRGGMTRGGEAALDAQRDRRVVRRVVRAGRVIFGVGRLRVAGRRERGDFGQLRVLQ
ncbi:TIGR04222 domain-containing membrane protein, partial [Burkholderia sp. Se-20373]|uniref:TIGR04222 domain-containing membrane protein n=1 Tax=Burkholderia sp. Se-20373 TaxID=2703898 RepID=UPI001F11A265